MFGSAVSTRDLLEVDNTPCVSTLVTVSMGHGRRQPRPSPTVSMCLPKRCTTPRSPVLIW
jgi:hypothetical protein